MNCDGKVIVPAAREMVTRPSSSSWRMVSRTLRLGRGTKLVLPVQITGHRISLRGRQDAAENQNLRQVSGESVVRIPANSETDPGGKDKGVVGGPALNGCIEPRRPLPVTPNNIVEVGLIKGLRGLADNETIGGAKIFAYRTGPQPSTPRTLSPALHRGGTSLVLEAPATCRRTAPAFRRQCAGPPRSAICLARSATRLASRRNPRGSPTVV